MLEELRETNKILRSLRKEVGGFHRGIAESNEMEVTKAVYQHLLTTGQIQERKVPLPSDTEIAVASDGDKNKFGMASSERFIVNFREYDGKFRVLYECDGLIPIHSKLVAVVEGMSIL